MKNSTSKKEKEYLDFGNGAKASITGHVNVFIKETGEYFGELPQISMPEDADYRWQCECLKDRLMYPEKYVDNENVPQVIEKLKKWISEYESKHKEICKCRVG